MLSIENLKAILPGIVTRVAINYPIAYINSVSFIVKIQLLLLVSGAKNMKKQLNVWHWHFIRIITAVVLFFKREPKPQIFSMAKLKLPAPMKRKRFYCVTALSAFNSLPNGFLILIFSTNKFYRPAIGIGFLSHVWLGRKY